MRGGDGDQISGHLAEIGLSGLRELIGALEPGREPVDALECPGPGALVGEVPGMEAGW